jgi:hypothetical protein
MTIRNVTTTLAGLVVLAASTTAGTAIWLLLTAPTTVANAVHGDAAGAFRLVVRALYMVLSQLVRYL